MIGLLDADREPLSSKELIQFETQQALDEESGPEPAVCEMLTAKKLHALSL